MSSTLFLQEKTKANSCPKCGEHLGVVVAKNDKVYLVCLTCGHELKVRFGAGRKEQR